MQQCLFLIPAESISVSALTLAIGGGDGADVSVPMQAPAANSVRQILDL